VNKDLKYKEIMEILCSNPVTTTVTIIEGKNTDQIADILSEKKVIDKEAFLKPAIPKNLIMNFKRHSGKSSKRKQT